MSIIKPRVKSIERVCFHTLTAQQWMNYAVMEITTGTSGGNIAGSLYDERLGVIDNGKICLTCGRDNLSCPGHFGYIALAIPVYNPKFLPSVQRILKCVCFSCSKTRLTSEQIDLYGFLRLNGENRLRTLSRKCDTIPVCSYCRSPQPSFDVRNGISYAFGNDERKPLPAKVAYHILSSISDDDFDTMGFNRGTSPLLRVRPESFIFTVLPVLPPCDRPPVLRDGKRYDDHLTEMYNTILRINTGLKESMSKLSILARETEEKKLALNVEALLDNHNGKTKVSAGGRAHKGIVDRVSGKDGRVRDNVVGKRSDYSSRAVITCGPHLDGGELGVPEHIAKILTRAEYVMPWNRDYCQALVDGSTANFVTRGDQRFRLTIAKRRGRFMVQIGDIVERQLRGGDWVLFYV